MKFVRPLFLNVQDVCDERMSISVIAHAQSDLLITP